MGRGPRPSPDPASTGPRCPLAWPGSRATPLAEEGGAAPCQAAAAAAGLLRPPAALPAHSHAGEDEPCTREPDAQPGNRPRHVRRRTDRLPARIWVKGSGRCAVRPVGATPGALWRGGQPRKGARQPRAAQPKRPPRRPALPCPAQRASCRGRQCQSPTPTLAPIWLPHWPAWMCTISLMLLRGGRCGLAGRQGGRRRRQQLWRRSGRRRPGGRWRVLWAPPAAPGPGADVTAGGSANREAPLQNTATSLQHQHQEERSGAPATQCEPAGPAEKDEAAPPAPQTVPGAPRKGPTGGAGGSHPKEGRVSRLLRDGGWGGAVKGSPPNLRSGALEAAEGRAGGGLVRRGCPGRPSLPEAAQQRVPPPRPGCAE